MNPSDHPALLSIAEALSRHDKEIDRCPFQNPPYPRSDKPCKVCRASSSESCRISSVADTQFVVEARTALSETSTIDGGECDHDRD